MNRRLLVNALLLVLLGALLGFNWWATPDPARPNWEFLPQMAHAPRYNAFAPNPNFANGQTLQTPPPGTIARGELPLHYAATPEDAVRAGQELLNPVSPDDVNAHMRGEQVFKNFCTPCHGANATGLGPVTQRGVPPPPSLLAPHAQQLKDGQIFHILTYGQNNMASYASQLSRADRWNAIVYIRSLQAATKPPAPAPPTKTARVTDQNSTGGAR